MPQKKKNHFRKSKKNNGMPPYGTQAFIDAVIKKNPNPFPKKLARANELLANAQLLD